MGDGGLFAIGMGVFFLFLAGVYVALREGFLFPDDDEDQVEPGHPV